MSSKSRGTKSAPRKTSGAAGSKPSGSKEVRVKRTVIERRRAAGGRRSRSKSKSSMVSLPTRGSRTGGVTKLVLASTVAPSKSKASKRSRSASHKGSGSSSKVSRSRPGSNCRTKTWKSMTKGSKSSRKGSKSSRKGSKSSLKGSKSSVMGRKAVTSSASGAEFATKEGTCRTFRPRSESKTPSRVWPPSRKSSRSRSRSGSKSVDLEMGLGRSSSRRSRSGSKSVDLEMGLGRSSRRSKSGHHSSKSTNRSRRAARRRRRKGGACGFACCICLLIALLIGIGFLIWWCNREEEVADSDETPDIPSCEVLTNPVKPDPVPWKSTIRPKPTITIPDRKRGKIKPKPKIPKKKSQLVSAATWLYGGIAFMVGLYCYYGWNWFFGDSKAKCSQKQLDKGLRWDEGTQTCQGCPSGTERLQDGSCGIKPEPTKDCPEGQFESNGNMCVCPADMPDISPGGKCFNKQTHCKGNYVWDDTTGKCGCPEGTEDINGKCAVRAQCDKEGEVYDAGTNKCKCRWGWERHSDWLGGEYCEPKKKPEPKKKKPKPKPKPEPVSDSYNGPYVEPAPVPPFPHVSNLTGEMQWGGADEEGGKPHTHSVTGETGGNWTDFFYPEKWVAEAGPVNDGS